MRLTNVILLVPLAVCGAVGCGGDGVLPTLPPATPGGGFIIETLTITNGIGPVVAPSTEINGNWQKDLPGAAGDPSAFDDTTNVVALASESGKRAPATWKFTWINSPNAPGSCNFLQATGDVQLDKIQPITCEVTVVEFAPDNFVMSPDPVYLSVPPSAGTVYGSGMTSTYGMPLVQYYTLDGTLAGQENASSVATDGNSMQVPGFDISQLPVGTYAAFVKNAAPGGTYTYLATGAVQVADGGVSIGGSDRSKQVCRRHLAGGDCEDWETVDDYGTVSITVNGIVSSVSYDDTSTPYTLAIALASAINSNTSINSLVYAIASGTTVMLDITSGSQYSLSAVTTSRDTRDFPAGSFYANASGSTF